MSDSVIQQIIESYLISFWANTTSIAWENVRYNSKDGNPFIEPTFECINSKNISINCERGDYLLQIIVNTKYNKGSNENLLLCDKLKNNFINRNESGIHFRNGKIIKIANLSEWYRRAVLINFYYQNIF